jgi:hypothetical protein
MKEEHKLADHVDDLKAQLRVASHAILELEKGRRQLEEDRITTAKWEILFLYLFFLVLLLLLLLLFKTPDTKVCTCAHVYISNVQLSVYSNHNDEFYANISTAFAKSLLLLSLNFLLLSSFTFSMIAANASCAPAALKALIATNNISRILWTWMKER